MKFISIVFLWATLPLIGFTQQNISGHSHNDYAQKRPFKTAFEAKMGSIEADVFLVNNRLYVAHEEKDIKAAYTLEDLYLKAIHDVVSRGNAYPFILLIDIKSQADSTLDAVVKELAQYPILLKEDCPVKFVISGNRPKAIQWQSYPSYIQFDGRPTESYSHEQWQRVGMVSQSFDKFVSKKGQKDIDLATMTRLKGVIDSIHAQGKRVRFWATADKKKVWQALAKLQVDFINTDKPKALRRFLQR
jgi:alkaline phosphatase